MAQVSSAGRNFFRKSFDVGSKKIQWFPGHMYKGMKVMEFKLKSVDCIVEVHDARIPFSGRNPNFGKTITGLKPHVLVLNKNDLADVTEHKRIDAAVSANSSIQKVLFTNLKDARDSWSKQILPNIINLIESSDRYNRAEVAEYSIMVIGVPNVGKSTLINHLRSSYLNKAKAAKVGSLAGVTRSVSEKIRVYNEPKIYLFDTPGILTPHIDHVETGLKLALCGALQDHLIGEDVIADYLLYTLNRQQNYSYLKHCGLDEPCDNIIEVLMKTAVHHNWRIKLRDTQGMWIYRPNFNQAACYLLREFRKGAFGPIMLDDLTQNDEGDPHIT